MTTNTDRRIADPPARWDSRVTRWSADLQRVRCKRCGEYKPLMEYSTLSYKDRRRPQSLCKPCYRVYASERARVRRATDAAYRQRVRAQSAASSRRRYEATRAEREQAAAERRRERRLLTDWAIAACRADGLTLTDIANALGLALSAISRWASGKTAARDRHLDRLVDLAFDHGAVWEEDVE